MKKSKLSKQPQIEDNAIVKYTKAGNVTDIQWMSKRNTKQTIQKISKDEYIDSDGVVQKFKHAETRADNAKSVYKSFAKLRLIINANCVDPCKVRWATLTYAENMQDTKRLYKDFVDFMKRFYYYCNKQGYERPEYIVVAEPQERGAWHMHLILIWKTQNAPFIPNATLAKIWKQGFVNIQAVKNCDNLGAYLTAYLADIELTEDNVVEAVEGNMPIVTKEVQNGGAKTEKKFIKGGRLNLYPAGMNIQRHSRGINKPEEEYMSYKNAKKKVLGATKTYETNILLQDDETGFESLIIKEQYNSKRKD